jgi:phosphatidylethanolamine-binding protein (PEBP) family uncharacterized protein
LIRVAEKNHGTYSKTFSCLDQNINPPLNFAAVPANAKNPGLIFEDFDAAPKLWTHWMIFDIPPETKAIAEGTITPDAIEGLATNRSFG